MSDKLSVEDIIEEYSSKKSSDDNEKKYTEETTKKFGVIKEEESEGQDVSFSPDDELSRDEALEAGLDKVSELMEIKREQGTLYKGSDVPPVNRATINDIDMALTGKIIPETAQIDLETEQVLDDDASYEEKSEHLEKKRRDKVEGFRLKTDSYEEKENSDDDIAALDDAGEEDNSDIRVEYDGFEDTPRIKAHISALCDSLGLRTAITAVCGAVSLFITCSNDLDMALVSVFDKGLSPSAFLFTNTLMGLIAIFVCYNVITGGIKSLFSGKPDCDSVAALGALFTTVLGVVTLFKADIVRETYYHVYICSGIMGLLFNSVGKLMIAKRTQENFRFVSSDNEKYAVSLVRNKDTASKLAPRTASGDPKLIAARKTDFVKGFMKNSYCPDIADKNAKRLAPVILLVGLVMGVLTFLFDKNTSDTQNKLLLAASVFTGTICITSPLSLMLAVNLPLYRMSLKATKESAVVLGFDAAREISSGDSIVTDAARLFPRGTVDLINLKVTSRTMIEECILMAASLSFAAGSVLQPTFYRMLKGKTEMLYPVESYIIEDGQGISGWIENKRVLLGTRELMEHHSIEGLPTIAKESEYAKDNTVLYLSISGIVSTLFVVKITADEDIKRVLADLEYDDVRVSVRAVDGFISASLICELFDLEDETINMVPFRFHKAYEARTGYKEKTEAGCLTSGHFTSVARLVTMSRNFMSVAANGMIFQYAALVLGAALTAGMFIFGNLSELSASVVCTYQAIMLIVTLVYQHLRRI